MNAPDEKRTAEECSHLTGNVNDDVEAADNMLLDADIGPRSMDMGAVTSLKIPTSFRPFLPFCVYITLSSAGPTMVNTIIPDQTEKYYGSYSEASFYNGLFQSVAAVFGLFLGGVFGRASDVFGRKIVLLISAFVSAFPYAFQCIFEEHNPWPFLITRNLCIAMGATQVGNVSIGFMVAADLFNEGERLAPLILYVTMIFVGLVFAPLPGVIGLSMWQTSVMGSVITLSALIHVWMFFDETLPPARRSVMRWKDLENPLTPLRFVCRSALLLTFVAIDFSQFFPFYATSAIMLFYLTDRIHDFTHTDNGTVMMILAFASILNIVVVMPVLMKFLRPITIVYIGFVCLMLQNVAYMLATTKVVAFAIIGPLSGMGFVAMPLLTQMISVAVPSNEQGVTFGTLGAVKGLSIVLGPIVGAGAFSVGRYHLNFIELPFAINLIIAAGGLTVALVFLRPLLNQAEARTAQKNVWPAGGDSDRVAK
jgi:DHA1 family tetracycline resistance protein-like MFS transporter